MTRPLLAALLAVLVVGASACGEAESGSARSEPTLRLGLVANTLGFGTSVGREQDVARRAGATWLREELSWQILEPRRGARRWRSFDRLMVSASVRHLRVLPLLSDTPGWATTPSRRLPVATQAYGTYVRDVVARYGTGGTFWRAHPRLDRRLAPQWFELWNEPYFVGPIDDRLAAERYAALVRAGIAGGRQADGRARFLLAADTSTEGRPGAGELWLGRLERADPGVLGRVDGIAAHPYGIGLGLGMNALDELEAALARRDHPLPIWITEVGWSTCTQQGGCVTEARQAQNLSAFLETVRRTYAGRIPAVFVYRLRDLVVTPAFDREGAFGLLRRDGRRKPAWSAFRRFADQLYRE